MNIDISYVTLISKKSIFITLNIIFLFLLLLIANQNRITNPKPLIKDSEEYARLSYNLANYNFFSYDGEKYTHFREPLTSFLNAINIKFFTTISEKVEIDKVLEQSVYVLQLTKINIFYLACIYLGIWWLVYILTQSHNWVIPVALLPMIYFSIDTTYLKSLLTELATTALLIFYIASLLKTLRYPTFKIVFISGILGGSLTLIKGVFYYLIPAYLIVVLVVVYTFDKKNLFRKLKWIGLSFLCYLIMIGSWMIRNYYHFNELAVAERGGTVLLIRAEKNKMTQEEFNGGFYFYSPNALKSSFFENQLSYRKEDYLDGGKLQRLNRFLFQDSIALASNDTSLIKSYLRRTLNVTIPKINRDSELTGVRADHLLKEYAVNSILDNPTKHLKTSILFAWRGLWFYQGNHMIIVALISLMYCSFLYYLGRALILKNIEFTALLSLPFMLFLFHTLLTHNIPRYTIPIFPFISLTLVLVIKDIMTKLNFSKIKFFRVND